LQDPTGEAESMSKTQKRQRRKIGWNRTEEKDTGGVHLTREHPCLALIQVEEPPRM
jgi:hypothetical protein